MSFKANSTIKENDICTSVHTDTGTGTDTLAARHGKRERGRFLAKNQNSVVEKLFALKDAFPSQLIQ